MSYITDLQAKKAELLKQLDIKNAERDQLCNDIDLINKSIDKIGDIGNTKDLEIDNSKINSN